MLFYQIGNGSNCACTVPGPRNCPAGMNHRKSAGIPRLVLWLNSGPLWLTRMVLLTTEHTERTDPERGGT